MGEPVERPKRKRGTYHKPGHKEVTTRMPIDLAAAVRDAAAEQGISVNDYIIRLCDAAIRDGVDVRVGAIRIEVRRALLNALARLDGIEEHEDEIDEEEELATAV